MSWSLQQFPAAKTEEKKNAERRKLLQTICTVKPLLWCTEPWAFFFNQNYSAEKTKYIDTSQPPKQGDER